MAPPRIDENKPLRPLDEIFQPQFPVVNDPIFPLPTEQNTLRIGELNLYGNQQKDRIERLYTAGLSGLSVSRDIRDVRLAEATINANQAYRNAYSAEQRAFINSMKSIKAGTGPIAGAPRDMVDVSRRAENVYAESLRRSNFTPLDVRGISVVKAAEFLRTYAARNGDFTTLSPRAIQQRIDLDQPTDYFVRILDRRYLNADNARFSSPNSPHTWVATPEEIAGAKLDVFEVMRRVGYSDSYISDIQRDVASGKRNLSDFILAVTEADATRGKTNPSWSALTARAKAHPDFSAYSTRPASFWSDVQNLDFKTELNRFDAMGEKPYLRSLSPYERDVFSARRQMGTTLGVNELFANDGRTARTDGRNGTFGVREFLVDNNQIRAMQRTTFLELNETGTINLLSTDRAPEVPDNVRNLRSETRTGALIGGTFSAVTSLPQVFDQAQNGDYLGAAQTFVTNTAVGTGTGAFSSASEKIIGDRLGNAFGRSTVFQNGLDRLYTNGAARNFISRTVQTEASTLTSTTFNSTARTLAGRVGGAGIVGGVVNGAFSAYDQIGAYNRGEVTASQAIGTVTGEAAVGVGAGLAGAAAGAAIGSIIPGAGTIVGGVIGFGVGMVAGYLADKGLRGLGVNTMIADGVTSLIDGGAEVVNTVSNAVSDAGEAIGNFADDVGGAISGGLKSIFG